ncbi:MAG: hypothetical protein AB2705_18605 [Candidatus Thiodiazotropha sp.]
MPRTRDSALLDAPVLQMSARATTLTASRFIHKLVLGEFSMHSQSRVRGFS